jgi:indole-3-glycerol phosphate synthase
VILDDILAHKADEVERRKARLPLAEVRARAEAAEAPRDFRSALAHRDVAIIAEVKRASPAKGALRLDLDPAVLADGYAGAGAAAVSVLTDERFFRGSDADLRAVRAAIPLPVLRKDFVLEPYQLFEARALGADAVLLIVRALSQDRLKALADLAITLGMASLVEVHDGQELERAIAVGTSLIGINNRDLTRMTVDLATSERLLSHMPADVIAVSESGIRTAADVRRLGALGASAVLVGEALVTSPDPPALLAELVAAGRSPSGELEPTSPRPGDPLRSSAAGG